MSQVFPNSKSQLLGEGEDSEGIIVTPAVAGLTGSVTQAEDADNGLVLANATTSGVTVPSWFRNVTNGEVIITRSGIVTPDDSVMVIAVSSGPTPSTVEFTKSWTFRRGGSILYTFSLRSITNGKQEADLFLTIDDAPLAGTHEYTLVSNDTLAMTGIAMHITFVKATDTHAGFIDTVAIAGKQINTPDSHTTHEQEVLPA